MSEFDRTEKTRVSIRRPRKALAPAPPPPINLESLQHRLPITRQKPPTSTEDVSSIIKRLLTNRRDFAHTDSTRPTSAITSPITTPVVLPTPRIVSAVPKSPAETNEDDSRSALLAIQRHINAIEFNQKTGEVKAPTIPVVPIRKTRYDEMESLLNTGISDLATNKHDTDDEDDSVTFQRGGGTRSSVQGVPTEKKIDVNKLRVARPVVRTTSDTKQHELLRKTIFRQKKDDEVKQVKVRGREGILRGSK